MCLGFNAGTVTLDWDDAKYAAASHVLIAYAYSGSESAATHGTSSEFDSWAKSELSGGTFAKMKAGAEPQGDINANDALLGHEGLIGAANMDPKVGIWFSLGEDGSSAPVDDSLATLPYGACTMTEMRCEANEGLELITRSFWIERDSTVTKAVWMGLDDQESPRISTTAKDAVAYKGLVPGETYVAVGTLMDKGAGEPFLDKDGNEVTAHTPFKPEAPSGTVEVTFEFDTEGLAEGDELVVFAADVVDVSAEGKRTDFANAAELDAYLGDKLPRCEVVLEDPADIDRAWAFVTAATRRATRAPWST